MVKLNISWCASLHRKLGTVIVHTEGSSQVFQSTQYNCNSKNGEHFDK
jgi:hypothetical protein